MLGVVTQDGKVRFPIGAYSVGSDIDQRIVTLLPCSNLRAANYGDIVLVECNGIPNQNINAASCNVREVVPPGMVSHTTYQFKGSPLLAKRREDRLPILASASGGEENPPAWRAHGGDSLKRSARPERNGRSRR